MYFLQKCIISAEDAKGSYSQMSNLDIDPTTKEMYINMLTDLTKHLHYLNDRFNYLKKQNPPE
jgi:hypothetical protein